MKVQQLEEKIEGKLDYQNKKANKDDKELHAKLDKILELLRPPMSS